MSVIVNVGSWPTIGLSIIKHLLDQVKIRLISQLIYGILRVLQKLRKYFNGTVILTFCTMISVVPATFVLNLKKVLLSLSAEKSAIAP